MAGVACAEWHLHAWDLARALGLDYSPANPELLAAGWQAGMPQLPLAAPLEVAAAGAARARRAGSVVLASAWPALLRASGRLA